MDTKESGMPSNKCRGNDEIRKLSFDKHHSYNRFIQETSMDAKTGRQELQDKQYFDLIVKCLPTESLLITKRKTVT